MLPPQMEISHRRSDLSGNSHQYNRVWACPDVGRRTDAWCKDAMLCCSMSTPLTHSSEPMQRAVLGAPALTWCRSHREPWYRLVPCDGRHRLYARQRPLQVPGAIAASRPDGHLPAAELHLGTTQLIQVDPLAVDQNRIADRVGRSKVSSEVGPLLKLHRHVGYLGPAALELQRNRDHVSFVSSRIEDNEITSAPFPSMSGKRQVRVNDDPLSRKTGVIDAALIPAQRLTDIMFAYRRPDSIENVTHGSRDSSSLFCRSADRL